MKSFLRGNIYLVIAAYLSIPLFLASFSSGKADTNFFETNPLSVYPQGIYLGIKRIIESGASLDQIRFNSPEDIAQLKAPEHGIFHPNGGGITYQTMKPEYMSDNREGRWVFNAELAVANQGQESGDITAYLIGVSEKACLAVYSDYEHRKKLKKIPRLNSDQSGIYNQNNLVDGDMLAQLPSGKQPTLDLPDWQESTGCFQSFDKKHYVYYHVVAPR